MNKVITPRKQIIKIVILQGGKEKSLRQYDENTAKTFFCSRQRKQLSKLGFYEETRKNIRDSIMNNTARIFFRS